jgi:hypothetical protein
MRVISPVETAPMMHTSNYFAYGAPGGEHARRQRVLARAPDAVARCRRSSRVRDPVRRVAAALVMLGKRVPFLAVEASSPYGPDLRGLGTSCR